MSVVSLGMDQQLHQNLSVCQANFRPRLTQQRLGTLSCWQPRAAQLLFVQPSRSWTRYLFADGNDINFHQTEQGLKYLHFRMPGFQIHHPQNNWPSVAILRPGLLRVLNPRFWLWAWLNFIHLQTHRWSSLQKTFVWRNPRWEIRSRNSTLAVRAR